MCGGRYLQSGGMWSEGARGSGIRGFWSISREWDAGIQKRDIIWFHLFGVEKVGVVCEDEEGRYVATLQGGFISYRLRWIASSVSVIE